MKKKLIATIATVCAGVVGVGVVAGVVPTTATKTMKDFMQSIQNVLFAKKENTPLKSPEKEIAPLNTPTEFSIDAEGNYSFKGVEGAGYYILQFYDESADSETDDYLFMSSPIQDTGADSYTGNCQDLFHYAFLNYTAKLYAYPAMGDSSVDVSNAAVYEYSFRGAIDAPEISYFYNTNTSIIEFYVNNMESSYYYQAYPDTIHVTLTPTAGKTIDLVLDDVDGSVDYLAAEIVKGTTYTITSYATSTNSAVTNSKTDVVTVAQSLELGNKNRISTNYFKSADNYDASVKPLYSAIWGWWPLLCESFNLDGNGVAGRAIGRKGDFNTKIETTEMADLSTLTEDQLTYKASCEEKLGFTGKKIKHAYSTVTNFNNANVVPKGHLFLYEDGSMLFIIGYTSYGPLKAGYLHGSWADNGDGTATLSYNPNDSIVA